MPPVDVFSEAQGLQRRRALLQALQQRAAAPQIQGTPGQGIAQLLASLGTSYFANQGMDKLDAREAELNQMRRQGVNEELASFLETMQGTPDQPLPPDMMGPPELGTPGDPKAAILSAMASQYPEMQDIGRGMLPGLLQKDTPKKFSDWQARDDGTIYRTDQATGAFESRPNAMAPKPTKPLVVNDFGDNINKLRQKDLESLLPKGEEYQAALAARDNLTATSEAVSALNTGAQTGFMADTFQALRKAAKLFGADVETASNDQLGAVLAQRVLALSSERPLAGPMSNTDLEFLRQSQGATTTDPEALRRILALGAAQSFRLNQAYTLQLATEAASDPELNFLLRHARPTNFYGGDLAFNQMFERAMAGKPTVDMPTLPEPSPSPNQKPASPIKYRIRGGG